MKNYYFFFWRKMKKKIVWNSRAVPSDVPAIFLKTRNRRRKPSSPRLYYGRRRCLLMLCLKLIEGKSRNGEQRWSSKIASSNSMCQSLYSALFVEIIPKSPLQNHNQRQRQGQFLSILSSLSLSIGHIESRFYFYSDSIILSALENPFSREGSDDGRNQRFENKIDKGAN